jgi:hypothetical protein
MDAVYSEAKSEYTKQLTVYILTPFHRFFMNSLQQASQEEVNPKRVLSKFQDILSQIPEWNVDKVDRETQKLIVDSRCDYLEELLTAVFIAHTKVLTAIRLGSKNKKVQITIPKLNHFLHRALTECSRLLWANVYLFQSDISSIDKQKNHRQIESLINEGIEHAIRGLLPVKNILKDYLAEGNDEEDEDDAHEEEEVKKEDKEDNEDKEKEHKEHTEEVSLPGQVPEPAPVQEQTPKEELPQEQPAQEVVQEVIPQEVVAPQEVAELQEQVQEKLQIEQTRNIEKESNYKAPLNVIKDTHDVQTSPEPQLNEHMQETLMLQSTPSVQFADMVHVFQPGSDTPMDFVNSSDYTTGDENDDTIKILDDDEGGDISDFEDLDAPNPTELGDQDFETL